MSQGENQKAGENVNGFLFLKADLVNFVALNPIPLKRVVKKK